MEERKYNNTNLKQQRFFLTLKFCKTLQKKYRNLFMVYNYKESELYLQVSKLIFDLNIFNINQKELFKYIEKKILSIIKSRPKFIIQPFSPKIERSFSLPSLQISNNYTLKRLLNPNKNSVCLSTNSYNELRPSPVEFNNKAICNKKIGQSRSVKILPNIHRNLIDIDDVSNRNISISKINFQTENTNVRANPFDTFSQLKRQVEDKENEKISKVYSYTKLNKYQLEHLLKIKNEEQNKDKINEYILLGSEENYNSNINRNIDNNELIRNKNTRVNISSIINKCGIDYSKLIKDKDEAMKMIALKKKKLEEIYEANSTEMQNIYDEKQSIDDIINNFSLKKMTVVKNNKVILNKKYFDKNINYIKNLELKKKKELEINNEGSISKEKKFNVGKGKVKLIRNKSLENREINNEENSITPNIRDLSETKNDNNGKGEIRLSLQNERDLNL